MNSSSANLISMISLIAFLMMVSENFRREASFFLAGTVYESVSLGLLFAVAGLLAAAAAGFRLWADLQDKHAAMHQSRRKLEKAEVSSENASERVKMLEQKVETLEAALAAALKKP